MMIWLVRGDEQNMQPVDKEDIQKPKMIEEYNSYMGGVDKSDQLLSYYGFDHRSVKWWKRVAFHLLDLSIVNAYVMYRQSKQEHYLTHEQFRIKLSKDLLLKAGIYFNDTPTQRPSASPVSRLTERHFPSKIPEQGKQHQMDCSIFELHIWGFEGGTALATHAIWGPRPCNLVAEAFLLLQKT